MCFELFEDDEKMATNNKVGFYYTYKNFGVE